MDSSLAPRDLVLLGETQSASLIRLKHLYGAQSTDYTPEASRLNGIYGRLPMCALEALDVFYLPHQYDIKDVKLACFDVDGTLLQKETFAELEARGLGEGLTDITERAMRGEIGFEEALRERVKRLQGVPLQEVQNAVQSLPLQEGTLDMMAYLHQHHVPVVLLTGGFTNTLSWLVEKVGATAIHGNTLAVDDKGVLTGRIVGECFGSNSKAEMLKAWAHKLGIGLEETLAVGDGANDIPMITTAGVGLGYRPKPILKPHCCGAFEFSTYRYFPMLFKSSYPDLL